MRRREVLTGTRGRVHIKLPSHLRKSKHVAAEGLFPGRALVSSKGGFTELPWIKAGPRAKNEESVGPTRGARATRQRQYHNHSPGGRI